MARLGQMLLAERLVTNDQLEEALEAQVIHGGRLGTNLVELGFLKEQDLARVLGKQHNMSFASGEMFPDPNALAVADSDFYDEHDVLPMRMDTTRLMVAITDPKRLQGIDDLGFKAGRKVAPVVIPEFRMHQLLRKHCKAFRPMRPIDMNTLRPRKQDDAPKPGAVGDLIDEGDFARLYANALEGNLPAVGAAAPAPFPAALSPRAASQPSLQAVAARPPADQAEPRVPGVPLAPPPSSPGPGDDRLPWRADPLGAPSPPVGPQRLGAQKSAPRPGPPPAPITFAEAQSLLGQSHDREDVARVVLRFAIGKFRRALLLSVRGDLLTGWHGMGLRVAEKAVQRIGLSLAEDNTFRLVRETRSHYVGPMKKSPGTEVFFKLLTGPFPGAAVMLPLLVRGKVVNILYVDMGPKLMTPPDVGELLILSQSVSRSYEAMISARKA